MAIDPATEWPFSDYRSSNWSCDYAHQSDTVLIFSKIGSVRRIVVEYLVRALYLVKNDINFVLYVSINSMRVNVASGNLG